MAIASNIGFPRIGRKRELKRATEGNWKGKISRPDLLESAKTLRVQNWTTQKDRGIESIPCNDFSFYDGMLDMACVLGLVPPRFRGGVELPSEFDLDTYFAMARGADGIPACELTKWFDTNYHFIVPEPTDAEPRLWWNKPIEEFEEAKGVVGQQAKPVLIGPATFILLGKKHDQPLEKWLEKLLPVYAQLLSGLKASGASWVQVDEPSLVTDLKPEEVELFRQAYQQIGELTDRPQIMLQTYYEGLGSNWDAVMELPVEGVGLDFVRSNENLDAITAKGFPAGRTLGIGIVNGRNVWRADLQKALSTIQNIGNAADLSKAWIQPSCSLMHLPYDSTVETHLPEELRNALAFAEQRLDEIRLLALGANDGADAIQEAIDESAEALRRLAESPLALNPAVRERVDQLTSEDFQRSVPFSVRRKTQRERLGLPRFPTTTIGSFPQTSEVRKARQKFRKKEISAEEYDAFIRDQIKSIVQLQEELNLDVLVHGEYERTDMVEFFGEQLKGFAFTRNAWVQSYGSRYVRPPILFGDVARESPMTVDLISYAQSLTSKPMKGMLTGPVTILNWSFVREDIPRRLTAYQVALALREEVSDLEKAEIRIVQVDEAAIREGLPLRKDNRSDYLDWAVKAFRLTTSSVNEATQVHTHMCYSEFGDMLAAIKEMDADVISIENSRSDMDLLRSFQDFEYDHEIGLGVYDIHSPQIPDAESIVDNLRRAAEVLDPDLIWVNPDCGLKTRGMEETVPSLRNMVAAAIEIRETLKK